MRNAKGVVVLLAVWSWGSVAQAQEPGDEPAPPASAAVEPRNDQRASDSDEPAADPDEPAAPPDEPAVSPKPVQRKGRPLKIGIGVHSRAIFMPNWLLGVAFEERTQMTSAAVGAEVVFRRGTFDIVGSVDLMFHTVDDGNFLGIGKNPATETDYLDFSSFNFFGFAVHFIKHHPVLPWMSIVWGGGVGFAITLGSIYRVSAGRDCNAETAGNERVCVPDDSDWRPEDPADWMDNPANHGLDGDSCSADQRNAGLCDDYNNPKRFEDGDMWPVVPTVHLMAGLDFKLSDHFSLRVDGGFRHLTFYVGATGHYFF